MSTDAESSCGCRSYRVPEQIDKVKDEEPEWKIDCEHFQLGEKKMDEDDRKLAMEQFKEYQKVFKGNFMGFQANQNLNYRHLGECLDMQLNNIGDPFSDPTLNKAPPPEYANPHQDGYFRVNTKWMERAVLDYYARLWNAPPPTVGRRGGGSR